MNQERFRANLDRGRDARRAGFTLIELLMVIVVIGILSSLLVVASMSVLGTSREAATKSTLVKVNTLLKQRMAAFEVMLDNDYTSGKHKLPSDVAGKDERLQKALYRKFLFKKYFPQSWSEIKAAELLSDADEQAGDSSAGVESDVESAEVLYAFLTKTSIVSQGEVGQDAFLASELADKDGDGKKELIDGWGNPLRFYRWPCRLIKPEDHMDGYPTDDELKTARTQIPALTTDRTDKAINSDPDNPLEIDLVNSIATYLADYHIPRTYHTPLIISSGVDGLFGLESPVDYTSTNAVDHRQAKPEYQTFIEEYPMPPPTEPEIELKRKPLYDNLTNLNALAGGTL